MIEKQAPGRVQGTGGNSQHVNDASAAPGGGAGAECRVESPGPVAAASGADVLDEVLSAVRKYVVFADVHHAVEITLWIAATYALPAWIHATRLVVTSPQKRCGKSRLLDVIAALCFKPLPTGNATTAAIYRSIGAGAEAPTLILDEADAFFGTKHAAERNEDLRALINAGWQRDRPVLRCDGGGRAPTTFDTFAMAALAAIGRLPDTITDRAVNVGLRRRGRLEAVSPFRLRRDGDRLGALGSQLAAWVRDERRMRWLTEAEPSLPVEDRAADAWAPLVAIADAAGGDWPRQARAACTVMVAEAELVDDEQSTAIQLLSGVKRVFDEKGASFVPSAYLVLALRAVEEAPWGGIALTPHKLASWLREFGIRPSRDASGTVRGYCRSGLQDAFDRYLRDDSGHGSAPTETKPEDNETSDGSTSLDAAARQQAVPDGPTRQAVAESSDENRCYDRFSVDLTGSDSTPTDDGFMGL